MRIAYLLAEDLSKHPGLKHKIDTQICYWQAAGHEVFRIQHFDCTVISPDGEKHAHADNYVSGAKTSKWQRLRLLSIQYEFVVNSLKDIKPDLTYSRYLFPAKKVTQIKEYSGRLVMEINSDDRAEYLQKRLLTGLYNAIFRRQVLNKVDGLVFVTNELANKSAFSSYTKQRLVIGNGVEVCSFEFVEKAGNLKPQLVFIGSPGQSWHGLDKVGYLAEQCPDYGFHVVGPNNGECMQLWGQIPNNITVHGYMASIDAQKIIKNMDVGIATLALYRKDMSEACPLKVRQYLAQGLSVIAASDDPDIQFPQSFYLQLPNNGKNVESNLVVIRDFVERVTGHTDIRLSARQFAEKYLSAAEKEAERLQFFEKVISS